jgi:hypothetical protein
MMKIGKAMKIAPVVLAFVLLVPIAAMAQTYSYGSYDNNDYSTYYYGGTSAGWTNSISQKLYNIPYGSTFSWYNKFHNADDTAVPIQLTASNLVGGTDIWSLGNLGPYSYTSNFQCTTGSASAVYGSDNEIYVQHVYNGPAASNDNQKYSST